MARIITAGFWCVLGALAAILLLSFKPGALLSAKPAASGSLAGSFNPDVFADGVGIYVLDDKKYNMLVCKKRILGPEGGPDEGAIMQAAQEAKPVHPGVRFLSYGMDFSKWPVVPPYSMAFCVARDAKTVEGIYPIRIKMVEPSNSIYELIMPTVIDNLASGNTPYLFWAINFQYSCNDGWAFKF